MRGLDSARRRALAAALATNVALLPSAATAHGAAEPDARESPSRPLEIVVDRRGADLVFYVDDEATDAPVTGLQADLRAGSRSLRAARAADGSYRVPADGVGDASTAVLMLHGDNIDESLPIAIPLTPPAPSADAPPSPSVRRASFAALALVGALLAIVMLALGSRANRRLRAARPG